jgi:hypothetical protein
MLPQTLEDTIDELSEEDNIEFNNEQFGARVNLKMLSYFLDKNLVLFTCKSNLHLL